MDIPKHSYTNSIYYAVMWSFSSPWIQHMQLTWLNNVEIKKCTLAHTTIVTYCNPT